MEDKKITVQVSQQEKRVLELIRDIDYCSSERQAAHNRIHR